jgi:serine/threonine-protein kinase
MDGAGVVLLTLFTSVLTAGGTVYVAEHSTLLKGPPAAEAVVPDMRGLSEIEARAIAGPAHVAVFVASHEPTSDAHAGTIVRQSIAMGQHVPPDSSVSVVLADEIPRVPSVLNVPLADAVHRLEERGYSVQVGQAVADEKVPVDVIVRQLPKPEAPYAQPGIVVVQPSAGPADVELPKLVGMGVTAAKTKAEELGLKVTVHWIAAAETFTNVVLNQVPAAGQKVKPGSEVQLTVCTP